MAKVDRLKTKKKRKGCFNIGDEVVVIDGPFKGRSGKIIGHEGSWNTVKIQNWTVNVPNQLLRNAGENVNPWHVAKYPNEITYFNEENNVVIEVYKLLNKWHVTIGYEKVENNALTTFVVKDAFFDRKKDALKHAEKLVSTKTPRELYKMTVDKWGYRVK